MVRINLLPIELQRKVGKGIKLTYFLLIPLIVILILIPIYIKKVNEIKMVKNEIKKVEKEMEKYRHVEEQLAAVEAQIALLDKKIVFIQEKKTRQRFWSGILDKIAATLPPDVWLDSLGISSTGAITMTGETFSWTSVANLIRTFNNSPDFVNASLASTSRSYGEGGTISKVTFQMSCLYTGGEKKVD